MRINVYSQELTDETSIVEKKSDTGVVYSGVRLMLRSSEFLHDYPFDDDRSAVTFWLPKTVARREEIAKAFEEMAALTRSAKAETGMD